jgi:predicted SnoaL-like aldol condensation-catalyzing enzyme
MSRDNKKTGIAHSLSHRWFTEVWNHGNENVVSEILDEEAVAYGLGEPIKGPEGFKPFYHSFRNEFSKIKVQLNQVLHDGDMEMAMCTVKAIHNKSHKPVKFTGMTISRIKNGKIKESWNNFDFLSMHLQIGNISSTQLSV